MASFNRKSNKRWGGSVDQIVILGDRYGQLQGISASGTSAFGEPVAVPVNPVIQLDGLYGLDSRKFETYTGTFTGNPGTATSTGTLMRVTTDSNGIGSYGVIRSRRAVRYRPGQGMLGRFTAKFSPGVAGYTQRAGFFSQEQAIQIGFDGENFGVLRQNEGKAHIQTIEVLTATQPEDITVTLNDDLVTFSSTAATTGDLAKLIFDSLESDPVVSGKWIFEWYENSIVALSKDVGPLAGAFSIATTGSSTFNNTTTQTGVAHNTQWTYQQDFSEDTLDGNGPSKMLIDPEKLNVFQINLRWLGAGRIQYAIEDQNGCMVPFHTEHYSNQNTDVHLDNPTMKLGYVAASLGGNGTSIVVEGASMLGAIEGNINTTSFPATHSALKSALSSATLNHIFSIKNRLVYSDKINLRELLLAELSAGITENAFTFGQVYLFLNAVNSLDHVWKTIGSNSHILYSDVAGTITLANEQPLASFILGRDAPQTIDLRELRIALPPNNILTVGIKPDANTPNAAVSLVWIED